MPADPRFHGAAVAQSLAAVLVAASATADAPGARMFQGVAALAAAGPDEIGFLEAAKHAGMLAGCQAGAVVLRPVDAGLLPAGCIAILSATPALAFAAIARLFHPAPRGQGRRHAAAAIAGNARLAPDVDVGACAVVGEGAEIGPGCILHPHAVVGPGVVLGAGCVIHSHASISHAVCGADVTLHPGARVGQEGFGFTPTAQGRFVTAPQLGRVVLEDRVEVGANACVDRGSLGDTVIGADTRIDNLVQVGHNVRTGSSCVLVALVGISGSTTLGRGVVMAGQSASAGHLHIGDGARIGAQAGVINNVPAGADMLGSPAQPSRQALRGWAVLRRLAAGAQKGDNTPRQRDDQDRA